MNENSDTEEMQAVTHEGGTVIFPRGVKRFAADKGVDLVFVDNECDVFTQKGTEDWKPLAEDGAPPPKLTTIK